MRLLKISAVLVIIIVGITVLVMLIKQKNESGQKYTQSNLPSADIKNPYEYTNPKIDYNLENIDKICPTEKSVEVPSFSLKNISPEDGQKIADKLNIKEEPYNAYDPLLGNSIIWNGKEINLKLSPQSSTINYIYKIFPTFDKTTTNSERITKVNNTLRDIFNINNFVIVNTDYYNNNISINESEISVSTEKEANLFRYSLSPESFPKTIINSDTIGYFSYIDIYIDGTIKEIALYPIEKNQQSTRYDLIDCKKDMYKYSNDIIISRFTKSQAQIFNPIDSNLIKDIQILNISLVYMMKLEDDKIDLLPYYQMTGTVETNDNQDGITATMFINAIREVKN